MWILRSRGHAEFQRHQEGGYFVEIQKRTSRFPNMLEISLAKDATRANVVRDYDAKIMCEFVY
jgi:hypothetical protein